MISRDVDVGIKYMWNKYVSCVLNQAVRIDV